MCIRKWEYTWGGVFWKEDWVFFSDPGVWKSFRQVLPIYGSDYISNLFHAPSFRRWLLRTCKKLYTTCHGWSLRESPGFLFLGQASNGCLRVLMGSNALQSERTPSPAWLAVWTWLSQLFSELVCSSVKGQGWRRCLLDAAPDVHSWCLGIFSEWCVSLCVWFHLDNIFFFWIMCGHLTIKSYIISTSAFALVFTVASNNYYLNCHKPVRRDRCDTYMTSWCQGKVIWHHSVLYLDVSLLLEYKKW